jgi:predicted peroxiredoxin
MTWMLATKQSAMRQRVQAFFTSDAVKVAFTGHDDPGDV